MSVGEMAGLYFVMLAFAIVLLLVCFNEMWRNRRMAKAAREQEIVNVLNAISRPQEFVGWYGESMFRTMKK